MSIGQILKRPRKTVDLTPKQHRCYECGKSFGWSSWVVRFSWDQPAIHLCHECDKKLSARREHG